MSRERVLNQDDKYFIIVNWENMTKLEMAKKLGVSKETVSRKGNKLGLRNECNINR